jgi:AcrR family transcriptional regulator
MNRIVSFRVGSPGRRRAPDHRLGGVKDEPPAPPSRPLRGRQAEAERNDRLVLAAAREVFARQGADAPLAAVAARAGVGMGSLYRRYGSKTELLQRLCILAMEETAAAAAAALAVEDPWEGLAQYVRACVAFGSGALAPLAGKFEATPRMREVSRRGRQLLGALVARAQQRGAMRPDATPLDVAWLIELFGRRGATHPGTEEENVRRRLLEVALDGLRAAAAAPLPGRPPSARYYESRWTGQDSAPRPRSAGTVQRSET